MPLCARLNAVPHPLCQVNPVLKALSYHFLGPDAALNFADVRLSQKEHTEAGLADAPADRERKFACNKFAVESEVFLPALPFRGKLRTH